MQKFKFGNPLTFVDVSKNPAAARIAIENYRKDYGQEIK